MAETALIEVAGRFGVPVTILVVIGLAIWRAAPWFAKRIDKVVDKVIEYMDRQAKTLEELARAVFLIQTSLDSFKTEVKTEFQEVRGDIEDLKGTKVRSR